MYQLTIATGEQLPGITEHPDRASAHRRLIDYVVDKDYYLQLLQTGQPHTSYELLNLGDIAEEQRCRAERRRPRTVGRAVIEELTAAEFLETPYYTAAAAQQWITEHDVLWRHGADNDPGARYPLAILHTAQAEGRYLFRAGALLGEAAELAGVEPIGQPDQAVLEALRHNATTRARSASTPSPAALAGAVAEYLDRNTPPQHTAALIWWYALITWGATAA